MATKFDRDGTAFSRCTSTWILRGRPRSPARGLSAKGRRFQPRAQPERRVQPPAAAGAARYLEAFLERRAVVAVLPCFKPWWCTDFHRAPVHRAAADATRNTRRRRRFDKTKDKDGYAVRAILPCPQRRGLPRTGSVCPARPTDRKTRPVPRTPAPTGRQSPKTAHSSRVLGQWQRLPPLPDPERQQSSRCWQRR